MENNSNFQNEAKNVNENVSQNVQKKQKNEKVKTVILIVIVMILVLVTGIFGGLLLSGNGDKVTNIISGNNENKVENKASKKIDESKPWVYDAEYCLKNKDKTAYGLYEGEKFNASEYLKAPWVNINSDCGKKINAEIEELYDRLYNKFGTKSSGGFEQASELKYESFNSEKILSLVIIYREGVLNSGWSNNYIIYNINLDTLEEASYEEVYKECGFDNENDVKKYAEITLKNLVDEDSGYNESAINYNKYYMKNGKINFLIPNPAGVLTPLEVINGVERNKSLTSSYFEQNKTLNYTSNPKDSINGKVAIIKMGEKTFQTTKNDEYYTYKDHFGNTYNIKEITNITSEYKMTGNNDWANLFKAVIEYVDNNNNKKSFDTAVIIPSDASQAYLYGPYEDYTGSTVFVKGFTELYDEGAVDVSIFSSFASLTYTNSNFKINNQENTYSCTMKFNDEGMPTLNVVSVSDAHNEAIFVTNDITNIKQDIAAGTSYVTFDFTAWTPGGNVTGTVQMRFSNVLSNETIGVKVSFDEMLPNFDINGDYIELYKVK